MQKGESREKSANAKKNHHLHNKSLLYCGILSNINYKFLAPDSTLSKKVMPDLLHPSKTGYEIWAKAMEPKVLELMGEK